MSFPLAMPAETPGISAVHLPLQALVGSRLSNPATVLLDPPDFEPSTAFSITAPVPNVSANFGDRVALGDLNDDGFGDIAVGSWFEDFHGVTNSGRAYVFWGPDYVTSTTLNPSPPQVFGLFGLFGTCVVVANVTGDGVDDLLVGEAAAYMTDPDAHGFLHLFAGGPLFSSTPTTISSAATLPSAT